GGTSFTGKEQAIVNWRGQPLTAISHARPRVRVRPSGKWITAPSVNMNRLHSFCESRDQQLGQFGCGKIGKSGIASRFKFSRQMPAEIHFDLWTAEGSEMICCGCRSVSGAEEAAVLFEFLSILERQEEFVSEAKRQSLCRFDFSR